MLPSPPLVSEQWGRWKASLQKIVPMSTFVGGFLFGVQRGFNDGLATTLHTGFQRRLVIVVDRGSVAATAPTVILSSWAIPVSWQVHGNQAYTHHVRVHERHENLS